VTVTLGLDIGSNSVGSAWIDTDKKEIVLGLGVFPAGVEDSDEKRGKPKNAARALLRRTRTTLARRAERKRNLRQCLTAAGLLPADSTELCNLIKLNPWVLRRKALIEPLTAYEFGRVLVHINQRRGAWGIRLESTETEGKKKDRKGDEEKKEGLVKDAIGRLRGRLVDRYAASGDVLDELKNDHKKFADWASQRLVTVGRFFADEMKERRNEVKTKDRRSAKERAKGNPRVWCSPVRNRAGQFLFHADRELIRQEFDILWDRQLELGGPVAAKLTPKLRRELDDRSENSEWRHRGIVFGQRRQTWDVGTLGRCVLEPSERCVPHADRFASYYRVVETVNNIRIIESGENKPLTVDQRAEVLKLLRGPLFHKTGKNAGKPKTTANVTDIREALGLGKPTKKSSVRLNIENDPDREINTDWFYREIVHGAIGEKCWKDWKDRDEARQESVNRAILKFNPEDGEHAERLRTGAVYLWKCTSDQAERLVAAWRKRPKLEERLNLSRRAIRNILAVMDAAPDHASFGFKRIKKWFTEIEARKLIAEDAEFRDVTTRLPLDDFAKFRYATGAKGLNKRDRYYQKKHLLKKDGEIVFGPDGRPIAALPPAPMLTNPVVRKAIHEVRRHVIEYLRRFGRKPDFIRIELGREARMTKKEADRTLTRNRLRNRIRKSILHQFELEDLARRQQNTAVERAVLAVQQGLICPICGSPLAKTPKGAAEGNDVQISHLIPLGNGGANGWSNKVLAHTKCNQDMLNKTPRDLWGDKFKEKLKRVEAIYKDRKIPKEEHAAGQSEWPLYFNRRDDHAKLEMFSKTVKDMEGFRESQLNDTRYATRQVMAYLADVLFEGKGLPERGGPRLIFASTGGWTMKFRREWELFFDPHGRRAKGLTEDEQNFRQEKNRGDHREHALDALVTALATEDIKASWEQRAAEAERKGVDEDVQRRSNPIPPPHPWQSLNELQEQVRQELFGDAGKPRPVAHRPAKKKIVGHLHKDTLYGAVLDQEGVRVRDRATVGQDVYAAPKNCLKPAHLRLACGGIEPKPEKTGIVRDPGLRCVLRKQLEERGLNPDSFTPHQLQATIEAKGPLTQESGVPIHRVVLLMANNDPVVLSRWHTDPQTGNRVKQYDAATESGDPRAARIYDGQNNHHLEIRCSDKGKWSGTLVSTFEVAQRNLKRLSAVRELLKNSGVLVRRPHKKDLCPPPGVPLRRLPDPERNRIREAIAKINSQHPLVNRSDDPAKGGAFVMSLAQGEMLFARRWDPKLGQPVGTPDYFVVAKLDPPNTVVLVPHWDGRRAKGRKDDEGKIVPQSQREAFAASPNTLFKCGPQDGQPPYKVRVDPLGRVAPVQRD
jgi:CRISPR-associated endonuclease Csn1